MTSTPGVGEVLMALFSKKAILLVDNWWVTCYHYNWFFFIVTMYCMCNPHHNHWLYAYTAFLPGAWKRCRLFWTYDGAIWQECKSSPCIMWLQSYWCNLWVLRGLTDVPFAGCGTGCGTTCFRLIIQSYCTGALIYSGKKLRCWICISMKRIIEQNVNTPWVRGM